MKRADSFIRLLMDEGRFKQLVSGEIVEWIHEGLKLQTILSDIGFVVMRRHVDDAAFPDAATDDELHSIFVNSLGRHGGFLTAFAESFLNADLENVRILRPAALALVKKYNLRIYAPHAFTANPLQLDKCKHCGSVKDHEVHTQWKRDNDADSNNQYNAERTA